MPCVCTSTVHSCINDIFFSCFIASCVIGGKEIGRERSVKVEFVVVEL